MSDEARSLVIGGPGGIGHFLPRRPIHEGPPPPVVPGNARHVPPPRYPVTDVALKIQVAGTTIKAWVDGTLKINLIDRTFGAGGVAFGGEKPKIDNLKIGYDDTGSRILARTTVGRHGARLLFAIAITR